MIKSINISKNIEGIDKINQTMGMPFENEIALPKPVTYKDIDESIQKFISEQFDIPTNGVKMPTYFFAQQRMSEFSKTWEMVDDNKNVIPDFKIITRDTNPKPGTLQDGMFNIPGDLYFTIGQFDKKINNQNITVSYKMKQPYCVDLTYNVKFITNRFNLLNLMNNKVNDNFKARQCYLQVNGHYMPVFLEDIDDESDYELDQRKIFIQNYNLLVKAYIINKEDIICEENLVNTSIDFNFIDYSKPYVVNSFPTNMSVFFPIKSKHFIKFKSDGYYGNMSVSSSDPNVLSYIVKINDTVVPFGESFYINKYDTILISIERESRFQKSTIILSKV